MPKIQKHGAECAELLLFPLNIPNPYRWFMSLVHSRQRSKGSPNFLNKFKTKFLNEFKFSCLHPRNMGPSVLNQDSSFWCFMEYIPSKIAKQTSCCIQCDLSETTRHRLWVETRERRYQDKRTSILEMMPTMMELWEQRSRRCLRWRNVDLWIPWKESLRRTLELEFCFHNQNQFEEELLFEKEQWSHAIGRRIGRCILRLL